MEHDKQKARELLYRLGVTANYQGFYHTLAAMELCVKEPERLLMVTKWVYPDVAKQCGSTWQAVERNIRRTSLACWEGNRALLEALARRPLEKRPSNARFLAILTSAWELPMETWGI